MPEPHYPNLSSTSADGRARQTALARVMDSQPTTLFSYHSTGRVVVVGDGKDAVDAVHSLLDAGLQCLLVTHADADADAGADVGSVRPELPVLQAHATGLDGYLGAFVLKLRGDGADYPLETLLGPDWATVDLVLDLGASALNDSPIAPPGYFRPKLEGEDLEPVLEELQALVGDFDKPLFFALDSDRCAHSRSGIEACRRCLDACPADAIRPEGDAIRVEPGLCQGAGVCATVCPSGAINYAYPLRRDTLNVLRTLLTDYRQAGGSGPLILFHDAEQGRQLVQRTCAELPEQILPVELAEAGSVGIEVWLSVLAWGGAARVLVTSTVPARVRDALEAQMGLARAILTGMAYPPGLLGLLAPTDGKQLIDELTDCPASGTLTDSAVAGFAPLEDKREALFMAIDHLHEQAPGRRPMVSLEAGAPFGEVVVNNNRCTLCMACVSQCPAGALMAGGESPALRFVEQQCIQCGMCSRTCPEDAIAPSPRLLFEAVSRRRERVLKEEEPFRCIVCGKPFATASMVRRIKAQVGSHPMFAGSARQRLEMCEDCRVIDLYQEEQSHADDAGREVPS